MSRNIIFVLIDCHHKLLHLINSMTLRVNIPNILVVIPLASARNVSPMEGRATAQVPSHQLLNTVAQVRSHGICGGESGIGAGFLKVLQFPLPIIPLTAPHSSLSIIWGWYNRPQCPMYQVDSVSSHSKKKSTRGKNYTTLIQSY
jgi:hypothetical protein